jgi:hypothetical protein
MKEKQSILNIILVGISIFIVEEFLLGILSWQEHWWILLCWFMPLLGGVTIVNHKKIAS